MLKVEAATTCGTDVKTYMRGHATIKINEPRVFGHECSGTVAEVGAGVTKFKLGDRVATHNTAPDGTCYYCKQNQPSMCRGAVILPGTFAQHVKIPARIVEVNA